MEVMRWVEKVKVRDIEMQSIRRAVNRPEIGREGKNR